MSLQVAKNPTKQQSISSTNPPVQNLFIITIDGFRWQEVFAGADSALISDEEFCPDTATMKMMYWASDPEERRRKLMPFFWNVLAAKGQIYGNRNFGNKVNVSNIYAISYAGYNEIFTGAPDLNIFSNIKKNNFNSNVLDYLNSQDNFKGSVVAFTSWDVFPYIFNEKRSHLKLNAGYETLLDIKTDSQQYLINKVQNEAVNEKNATRQDQLTFLTAKEYIEKHRPRVVFLGLGETDEMAHKKKYDLYLQKASEIDKMIGDLWHWVQSTPGYKDNTTIIITTDHGRGKSPSSWANHAFFIKGSSQTWLALIGPNITALGERKNEEQIYQEQIAQTIASLVGQNFQSDKSVAPAIVLK